MEPTGRVARDTEQSLRWHKSSLSGNTGCLEVARAGGLIYLRDTDDNSGHVLTVPEHSWVCFSSGAKLGDFDQI